MSYPFETTPFFLAVMEAINAGQAPTVEQLCRAGGACYSRCGSVAYYAAVDLSRAPKFLGMGARGVWEWYSTTGDAVMISPETALSEKRAMYLARAAQALAKRTA